MLESDCAFRKSNSRCNALINKKCKGCSFYKTAGQLALDNEKSEARLKKIKWKPKEVENENM